MKTRYIALVLAILLLMGLLTGCQKAPETAATSAPAETAAPTETAAQPVTLTVAGSWDDCRAIEAVGREFTALYPNCTIVYEQLQDYYTSVEKRMTGENAVDIFFTTNIQEDSALLPYVLDLKSSPEIDLSTTFEGLIENFAFIEKGERTDKLYAIPLGAELRGLYVNKTLLSSLGIAVPTNQAELLAACETLKQAGYIPFHGNPGDFSQTLLYPWVCNLVANAEDPQATYAKVNAREPGLSELFREPFAFLYTLVEKGYYDYKRAQSELNLFTETTYNAYAKDFFNVRQNGETWEKADDVGQVAFMPSTMSLQSVMDKTKDDYHSSIEYAFVLAPVGVDGGFAYMSPSHGIAVNKGSVNVEWSAKFINFLFQPEQNKLFAGEFNCVPNTKEAFAYIATLYDVPDNRISHLGEVTFGYDFYTLICASLRETSKANNPKYMQTNEDGSVTLYPLEYYLNSFEESMKGNE